MRLSYHPWALDDMIISEQNFRLLDVLPYAKEGTLEQKQDEVFGGKFIFEYTEMLCMNKMYQDALYNLWHWVEDINNAIGRGMQPTATQETCVGINKLARVVAEAVHDEYPYYSQQLPIICNKLFSSNGLLNMCQFPQLYFIAQHLHNEPKNLSPWQHIHPKIIDVAQKTFFDGHYANAAGNALKAVEEELRILFRKLKKQSIEPREVQSCIGGLLGEKGALQLCDCTTHNGKNYTNGIKSIFEGAFYAYRNPEMHSNLKYTYREALEQIMLASQLMYIINSEVSNNDTANSQ